MMTENERFKKNYGEYYQTLCNYVSMNGVDRQESEDIVTDVFIKLLNDKYFCKADINFKLLLYRCVSNKIKDFYKHKKVQHEYASEHKYLCTNLISENSSHNLFYEDLVKQLDTEIDRLPTQCGQIFRKFLYEEKSRKEIAEEMRISTKTVNVHIRRAREKIIQRLKKKYEKK
jgi:RNA polymerase sigma-70 factor (ECF subfamily)